MPSLSRKAAPLLRVVDRKQHATERDHQVDDDNDDAIHREPESTDDDDDDDGDVSNLGGQRTQNQRHIIRAPRSLKRSLDPEDSSIFGESSQSSQSKKIKTFSRKPAVSSLDSRRKPKAAFQQTPAVATEPPARPKKTFRALATLEPSSSQPDAPPAAPTSRFHKTADHSRDLSIVSAQSPSSALGSSQLSLPPSSPRSSPCTFEPELDLDMIGKVICPICGDKIETDFWDSFQLNSCFGKRMNLRLQEKFCQAHKARNAGDIWKDRGYPTIDWSKLPSRLSMHHKHIRAVLDGTYESPYRKQHAKILTSKKGKSAASVVSSGNFATLRAGYYGTKGEKLMAEHIVHTFSDKLRALSTTDPLIARGGASGGMSGFVYAILVPEMALGLIMEDMSCNREEASVILADSADVGELCNGEEDEKLPRVEIDLLGDDDIDDDDGYSLT